MKQGLISQLRWTKPDAAPQFASVLLPRPPAARPLTSTARGLDLYGIPELPIANATPADTALFLLKAASEIEHGLLVQYLYAMYSIGPAPVPPNWSSTIRGIALQEMDHLATVQNMLLLLKNAGFQPYFDRANFPIPKEHQAFYPYPFRLEPFTADSLAKYVSVESPLPSAVQDPALRAELETIIQKAEAVTGVTTFGHVGNLYAYLYWLFLPSDDAAGPWPRFPSDWFRNHKPNFHLTTNDFVADQAQLDQLQINFKEVNANDGNAPDYPNNDNGTHRWIFAIKTTDDALRAISQIAIQGEGTEVAGDSHFLEFLTVYRQLTAFTGNPHHEVPADPHLRSDPNLPTGFIANTVTRLWAELCNTRYLMLLTELPLAMSLNRLDASGAANQDRVTLISKAVQTEMRSAIPYFKNKLLMLPIDADPAFVAAPPFELPAEKLPADAPGRWKELVRLIGVVKEILKSLRALTGADKPTTRDEAFFRTLEAADQSLLQIVPAAFKNP